MQTRDQKPLLLDMQEHPENYTDEQLEAMMDSLDQMPDAEQAWDEFEQTHPQPLPVREGRNYILHLRKIAAILIPAIFLSGLAWAISTQIAKEKPVAKVTTPLPHREGQVVGLGGSAEASIRFDDVRLDSILTVVSAHYGKAVRFRSEEAKSLKFIMMWNPDAGLADFIDRVNMFDGLRLTLQRDTVFVDTADSKVSI